MGVFYHTSCPQTTPGIVIAALVAAIHRGAGGIYQECLDSRCTMDCRNKSGNDSEES